MLQSEDTENQARLKRRDRGLAGFALLLLQHKIQRFCVLTVFQVLQQPVNVLGFEYTDVSVAREG